ncbi:hypothetical protein BKI52_27570 [marine bacterium AO1-C]|nr:hypothetical protein BKI52_27570 [marine bacterium AO1-C]
MHKYTNEEEILAALERQALLIEQKINKGLVTLEYLNDELPGASAISTHDTQEFKPVFISKKSLRIMQLNKTELLSQPLQTLSNIVFPGDFQKNAHWVARHLSGKYHQLPVSYIQRMKLYGKSTYTGIYTLSKKNSQTNNLMSIYLPIVNFGEMSFKFLRLLEENLYIKANYYRFAQLTNREKEIITLLALGFQNNEIADQLFISKSTVEQHRKNLKRKLEIKRFVDLIRFAQAFDLIY